MLIKSFTQIPKGLVFIPVLFFFSQILFVQPEQAKRSDYLPPPAIIKYLSIGLNTQFSDSFWLRAVQDFDFCENKINDTECKGQSWLFQVIDLSVDLDPQFVEAYFYGGLALTVLVSDYEGASKIFDKGVAAYPKNWELNYAAGYHSMIEEKNYVKAAQRYFAAANNGAPSWVKVLAGKMAAQGGDTDFAEKILEQMISISDDPKLIARLKAKLEEKKKQ